MILTWREEIIDKITNGALTVWCEAVEKAISLIDGNRILDENIYISISDTSVNHSRESNELLTYCSLEGDDCTEISYYTNLPYSGLDSNEDEIKKYHLLFDTMKTILEREGLEMVECEEGMLQRNSWTAFKLHPIISFQKTPAIFELLGFLLFCYIL